MDVDRPMCFTVSVKNIHVIYEGHLLNTLPAGTRYWYTYRVVLLHRNKINDLFKPLN